MKAYQETALFTVLLFLVVIFSVSLIQRFGIKAEVKKNQEILHSIQTCKEKE